MNRVGPLGFVWTWTVVPVTQDFHVWTFYADGLLWLYEATFNRDYLQQAEALAETIIALFKDEERVGFFSTSSDHEELLLRPRDWDDNATPSGNSVAIEVLLRLAILTVVQRSKERHRHPIAVARTVAHRFRLSPRHSIIQRA